jgi:hypothetical protein
MLLYAAAHTVCCNAHSLLQRTQFVATHTVCCSAHSLLQRTQFVATHTVCCNGRLQNQPGTLTKRGEIAHRPLATLFLCRMHVTVQAPHLTAALLTLSCIHCHTCCSKHRLPRRTLARSAEYTKTDSPQASPDCVTSSTTTSCRISQIHQQT